MNIMTFVHSLKLGFEVWKTNIKIQKVDKSILAIYKIAIRVF